MSVKERLLAILRARPGEYISGEAVAEELGCSRGAVWKAAAALKKEGYVINAVTNRGYRLEESDVLSLEGVAAGLSCGGVFPEVRREVSSTNTLLKERAAAGAPEGTVAVAGMQTAGRGRMGRSFFSPSDTGLYLSILLRPEMSAGEALRLTTAAAVAVALAIEKTTGTETGIKWVNDVYSKGRKLCGILTEAAFDMESGGLEYAIVGIGVNVYEPEGGFPEEIRDIAGACAEERRSGLRNALAAEIINGFMGYYRDLPRHSYLEEYRRRLLWLGERVRVIRGNESYEATVTGVDDSCALTVITEDGEERKLASGEISIRAVKEE